MKTTTNIVCAYLIIRFMLFTSIVQIISLAWITRALIQCWGRKSILIIRSVLLIVGSNFCDLVIFVICRDINLGDMKN
ncbi:hypothetical protein H5410_030798 [Solanum commersonii]|uniref:Uncharacterized protein n=1 Tax=Solanum commersonii TaxID=4109 RepID=A0A9J5YJS1_SOLCO|nr:hypothetical protein H5410_030798 [Solanum commersonii]